MKIGLLPFARATFDVAYAEDRLAAMKVALAHTDHDFVGSGELLFEVEPTRKAFGDILQADVDLVLVLQVTFTDAALLAEAAQGFDKPLAIWAVPEPRLGGRLRLNAFCGLNLGSHALGLRNKPFGWLYADPDGDVAADLDALLAGGRVPERLVPTASKTPATDEARAIVDGLKGTKIGRIGMHPPGFDTCAYDAGRLNRLTGVDVEELDLPTLFETARSLPAESADAPRATAASVLEGLDEVDQDELDRSFRLKAALDKYREAARYDAFALRCWPETFTEYGGAICGPAGMLGEERIPCACEADVYGALTQMLLARVADAPVFLVDLVDMDVDDDTGVVWHCGQAPASMRDPDAAATATIHTNRRMPLLYQFALKPGRVTFLRVSQAFGETSLVIAGGEMLKRPMAFTGTSGVVRFDRPARDVLDDVIASGLEHHTALAYGDHRERLREVATAMNLPVIEL